MLCSNADFSFRSSQKFSKLFSGKPAAHDDVDAGVDLKEFKDVFATGNIFAAGMSIDYADSIVSGKTPSKQELATKLPVGQRFFGAQVVNQASATPDMLTTRIPFTGAFHLLVFAGDVAKEMAKARLQQLADYLDGAESVVSKYTPSSLSRSAVIDVVTIRSFLLPLVRLSSLTFSFRIVDSADRTKLELYDFPQPSIFQPHNYKRIYTDNPSCPSLPLFLSLLASLTFSHYSQTTAVTERPTRHTVSRKRRARSLLFDRISVRLVCTFSFPSFLALLTSLLSPSFCPPNPITRFLASVPSAPLPFPLQTSASSPPSTTPPPSTPTSPISSFPPPTVASPDPRSRRSCRPIGRTWRSRTLRRRLRLRRWRRFEKGKKDHGR